MNSEKFKVDFYASPTGKSSADGSLLNPWDLQTALGRTSLLDGKTLGLKGGVYKGKYKSFLKNATVRSCQNEWVVIDGYKETKLLNDVSASQESNILLESADGVFTDGTDEICINGEVIKLYAQSGNKFTGLRAASGSTKGAIAHKAGDKVIIAGTQFYVEGSNTIYRDFEIMNSLPNRDANLNYPEIMRGNGVFNVGDGNSFINLIVHDNISGVFTSAASSNTEFYGCLTYNNGIHKRNSEGVEEGLGHGMYLENSSGYSRIHDCISLNNFNLGTQCFGATAAYVGGDLQGNLFANSGSPLGKFNAVQRNINLLIGTDEQRIPSINLNSNYFFHPHDSNGTNLKLGYGAGVDEANIEDCCFVGGSVGLEVQNTSKLTALGNNIFSRAGFVSYVMIPSGADYDLNFNRYHKSKERDVFAISGIGMFQFADWKDATGFDWESKETAADMPDIAVIRPNKYQKGRANVIVYVSGTSNVFDSVQVDLSKTGLADGQGYEIKNAFDYFGESIVLGVYFASTPIINVYYNVQSVRNVAAPIGYDFTPPTTSPNLCVFIIEPKGEAVEPPKPPVKCIVSGTVKSKKGVAVKSASVWVDGKKRVVGNAFGQFVLQLEPNKSYSILVKARGLLFAGQKISPVSDTSLAFVSIR